jgi:hypothetical protein
MSSVIIAGNTSGSVTLSAPAISGSSVLTLPVATDTLVGKATTDTLTNKTLTAPAISSAVMTTMASSVLTSATAVASTSGTSIDFTGIPSWVKRITVMLNGVSTNGVSPVIVQIGTSGGIQTTSYLSVGANRVAEIAFTTGLVAAPYVAAAVAVSGNMFIANANTSTGLWVSTCIVLQDNTGVLYASGTKTLSGTLDRVRITTVNGTDTFDAGSINILYE